MKVLFLDIDGVLNSDMFYSEHMQVMSDSGYPNNYPYTEFDYRAVERINRIVKETGCNIVISSDWRLNDDIKNVMSNVGIDIFDKTPYMFKKIRGEEIDKWLSDNSELDIENYVILDDARNFLKKQKKHTVICQSYSGLTDDIADRVINKLNSVE